MIAKPLWKESAVDGGVPLIGMDGGKQKQDKTNNSHNSSSNNNSSNIASTMVSRKLHTVKLGYSNHGYNELNYYIKLRSYNVTVITMSRSFSKVQFKTLIHMFGM
jgi:hypothetical protein